MATNKNQKMTDSIFNQVNKEKRLSVVVKICEHFQKRLNYKLKKRLRKWRLFLSHGSNLLKDHENNYKLP